MYQSVSKRKGKSQQHLTLFVANEWYSMYMTQGTFFLFSPQTVKEQTPCCVGLYCSVCETELLPDALGKSLVLHHS